MNPKLELITEGSWDLYKFAEDWTYEWYCAGRHRSLTIPAGFITDLASVPKVLRWWIDKHELKYAAIVHDFIYAYAGNIPENCYSVIPFPSEGLRPWTRREADRLFGRMMREDGIPPRKRRTAVAAVIAFGWVVWRRARNRSSTYWVQ